MFNPQCPPVAPKAAPQDLYIVVDRTTPMAPYRVDDDRDNLIDLADPQCRYSCRNYEGTIE